MTEQLTRLCDCGACRVPLGDHPVGAAHTDGAYCSEACAGHAGGTLRAAEAEHRQEGQ